MFARDLTAAQHFQVNQPIAPQFAQSLASQTTPGPAPSVHEWEHNSAAQVVVFMLHARTKTFFKSKHHGRPHNLVKVLEIQVVVENCLKQHMISLRIPHHNRCRVV